jgi:hypothetical protein
VTVRTFCSKYCPGAQEIGRLRRLVDDKNGRALRPLLNIALPAAVVVSIIRPNGYASAWTAGWFYSYKIRAMKVAESQMRKNLLCAMFGG